MKRGAIALAVLLAAAPAFADQSPVNQVGTAWDRYQVILWHTGGATAAELAAARRLGATAGLVFGVREPMPQQALAAALERQAAPLEAAGLRPYVENIATDFYAAYHRWRPDRPVTWAFDQVQARHQADPSDRSVFLREPSLSDPDWLGRIETRLAMHARVFGGRALYYSLGDETGIADLTAAWDFDFSPASLAGFRAWLRGQYGSLAALNAEWNTGFADWDAVVPLPTAAALAVRDGNFSAWADFKAWMDTAYAGALRAGTDALHRADPAARSAIEGAQVPGTGGYDYTKIATAVDVMEVTGGEPALDLAHAFNPALVLLTTDGRGDAAARHALWQALLAGSRGAVLWDPDATFARPDGSAGPRGKALAPLFAEFEGALGTALIAARPKPGPVAVLYSPASFRTRWLLDRQRDAARGEDFSRRRSETELEDNAPWAAMRQAAGTLAHLAFEPRWLSPAALAGGALRQGVRALLLPQALDLSDAALCSIRDFVAAGGKVFADVPPGGFDGHSRRRAAPLADGVTLLPDFSPATLGPALARAGVDADSRADSRAGFRLERPDGAAATDVTVRVLRRDAATLLGIQRDFSEATAAEDVVLVLPAPRRLRDLRAGTETTAARLHLRLDPVAPAVVEIGG